MLHMTDFYYFSPTGGTKKIGEGFSKSLAEQVKMNDLMGNSVENPVSEVAVVAAPVFGGRIPTVATERLKMLDGKGKKAVTIAVYGTRAYEDALLELNHTMKDCGFEVVASAALIAQHSIVPIVGAGRPDDADMNEIHNFAKKVLEKIEKGDVSTVEVPGNCPYKDGMDMPVTPISLDSCNQCGVCVSVCPTDAIVINNETLVTNSEQCILCMACVAKCPKQARILPPPMQANMNEKLGALKDVRRENEFFL